MCKCQIRWTDDNGNETPDDNEAIGIAVCTVLPFVELSKRSFPICAKHYTRLLRMSDWKLEPLPEVVEAIKNAFPKDADDILKSLRYHAGDNFWSFNRWGMFVGVEQDGFIHS